MFNNFDLTGAFEKLLDKLSGWGEGLILKTPNFIIAILVFIAFWYTGKFLSKWLGRFLLKKPGQESIKRIVSRGLFIIIVMIGFFVALGILDLDKVLTSVLAGAGVIGHWSSITGNFEQYIFRDYFILSAQHTDR